MPVSRTVARRVGSTRGFDADAAAYIRAVQTADGAALEPAVAFAINNFVLGCKADSIWSAIKASCILMGARTLTGALTALVGSSPTNNNFVSGDYNRKTGLLGNASTKWLNSGRNNNADGQDDQHLAVYVSAVTTRTVNRAYIGAGLGDNGSSQIVVGADGSTFYRSRSGGTSTAVANGGLETGFHGISRSGSSSFSYVAGSLSGSLSLSSQTPFSQNVVVFGRNLGASADGRLAFYSIGSALTLSLLGSRLATLYTAIGAAIP